MDALFKKLQKFDLCEIRSSLAFYVGYTVENSDQAYFLVHAFHQKTIFLNLKIGKNSDSLLHRRERPPFSDKNMI